MAPSGRVDGRTARAERTRRAIVDALLALIGEGDLKASPERIVERAGVSLRTLWTHFKDLEASTRRPTTGSSSSSTSITARSTRPAAGRAGSAFCEQRGRMLEIVAPAARAAALRLPFSAQLRRNQAVHNARIQAEIEAVFAGELAAAGPGREPLLRALVVNTTWPAWSVLRDELGLDVDGATAVMTWTVGALLAA